MRQSQLFAPTLRETPAEAEIVSHRLMLRAGLVRQASAGIYSWLPLGKRVLAKIERIVREEQNAAGAQEILMPTIQSADLWRKSGRYDAYGAEMLRIRDRQDRDLLYGPTNEEQVTEIFRNGVASYRDLPLNLYHIQWKFRDEIRPRFGVMRGREFLMKDAYSFDLGYAGARVAYNKMFIAYLKTFSRMGLQAIPMAADTGPIGGDLSHEFIVLADTGESAVFCHADYLDRDPRAETPETAEALQAAVDSWTALYAATDEKHDAWPDAVAADKRLSARGIEVGHIFYFGTKYADPMDAAVQTSDGGRTTVHMGSYGIGVSRLVGAVIEAHHDDAGCVWPIPVAPFDAHILNLRPGDAAVDGVCASLYDQLKTAGLDPLLDDRGERAGAKFADADLIGLPWRATVGPKSAAEGKVELRTRADAATETLGVEAAVDRIRAAWVAA